MKTHHVLSDKVRRKHAVHTILPSLRRRQTQTHKALYVQDKCLSDLGRQHMIVCMCMMMCLGQGKFEMIGRWIGREIARCKKATHETKNKCTTM